MPETISYICDAAEEGRKTGLPLEAACKFAECVRRVEVQFEVNEETGEAVVVKVNGRKLKET